MQGTQTEGQTQKNRARRKLRDENRINTQRHKARLIQSSRGRKHRERREWMSW